MNQSTLKPDTTPDTSAVWIPRERIRPNPDQPRRHFDHKELAELAGSMAEHGQLQSIVVRYEPSRYDATPYLIVSGERRWRAAENILGALRCTILNVKSDQMPELALVENIQRVDLTPIEQARGIAALMDAHKLSKLAAARRLKKHPNWINNRLSLLKTAPDVQEVAARVPDKMLSLIEIDTVRDDEEVRAELLDMATRGVSHDAIMQRIAVHRQAATTKSSSAPDAQTQTRLSEHARTGGGQMSRGRMVTVTPRSEVRSEIESTLSELERHASNLKAWAPRAESKYLRERVEPRLAKLRRQLREIEGGGA